MFREMRRNRQQLSREECTAILEQGTSGVLALPGDDGYPYAVPLSYVYHGGKFFFHSAVTGHKIDAIAGGCKASFCVIAQDKVIPERYTTQYRSVIAFGTIRILEQPEEKLAALQRLADKYYPGHPEQQAAEIAQAFDHLCMIELTPAHITGKEGLELTRMRAQS